MGKFFVEYFELGFHYHDGAAVLHHQIIENPCISELPRVEADDLALFFQSPGLHGDLLLQAVFAVEQFYDIVYTLLYNGAVKGLVYKIRNAQFEAIVFNRCGSLAADDQNRYGFELFMLVHPVQDRVAVHIRHLQVQKKGCDAVRAFLQLLNGLGTVLRDLYNIIVHQHITQYFAVDFHIICY